MAMRVLVSGATGFIGRELCRRLCGDHEVIALSRDARKAGALLGEGVSVVEWDARTTSGWAGLVEGAHAVINLAGENVAAGRWTVARKSSIVQSRTDSVTAIVEAVNAARKKSAVVIQASAIGYYGSRGDEALDEEAAPGSGFLADICQKVESLAAQMRSREVRVVTLRTGVVLGIAGGALPKLMMPFRLYLGGRVGSGRQWFSWIGLADEVRAIRFLMELRDADGAFNLTAPEPVPMKRFCQVLGETLGKPVWTVMPEFLARLGLGQMADEMILTGQRVLPRRLMEAGFEFEHPRLRDALTALVQGEEGQ
jgi:uncharacterized protein (TIGR01777 family)